MPIVSATSLVCALGYKINIDMSGGKIVIWVYAPESPPVDSLSAVIDICLQTEGERVLAHQFANSIKRATGVSSATNTDFDICEAHQRIR